jgi:hypothetical protein
MKGDGIPLTPTSLLSGYECRITFLDEERY